MHTVELIMNIKEHCDINFWYMLQWEWASKTFYWVKSQHILFFYGKPDSKYFMVCGSQSLCCSYSSATAIVWKQP